MKPGGHNGSQYEQESIPADSYRCLLGRKGKVAVVDEGWGSGEAEGGGRGR